MSTEHVNIINGSVAQLDRAFDYESKGRRFESCRGHHTSRKALRYYRKAFLLHFYSDLTVK